MKSGHPLDLQTWHRRANFEHFRSFDQPFFQICAPVTVGPTWDFCRAQGVPYSLACWFLIRRAANQIEPFRYRLRGTGVWVHGPVGVSMTVLRPDDSFAICRLPRVDRFEAFVPEAKVAVQNALRPETGMDVRPEDDGLLHGSTLPWLRFTSITHARETSATDSVPKIVVGRVGEDHRGVLTMPVAVDVHHALMDGLHVARFLECFEALLAQPEVQLADSA
jgi:chloramphenicol O-acetyltransferase type A